MIRGVLLLVGLLAAPLASAGDINGFWQHAYEPGWIEIRLDEGRDPPCGSAACPQFLGGRGSSIGTESITCR